MNQRRLVFYSSLVVLAGGLLYWQWWTEPRHRGERLAAWLGRVSDPDAAVRAEAATALGKLGHDSDKAWNELASLALYDADDDVRANAVTSLNSLCRSNASRDEPKRIERKRRVLRTLLDGFRIGNADVRRRVPEVVYEVAGLEFHERGVRRFADDVVDRETRPAAVKAMIGALKDVDEEVRDNAVQYLGKLATVPAEAEPGLLDALRSKDAVSRSGAAGALQKLERISDAAVPGLIVAVQDDSPDVRRPAFDCLIRIGPKAIPAIKEAMAKTTDMARRGYLELCLKAEMSP